MPALLDAHPLAARPRGQGSQRIVEAPLSRAELVEAEAWLADCFADLPEDLTDAEIVHAIRRHFDGGLDAFRESCAL